MSNIALNKNYKNQLIINEQLTSPNLCTHGPSMHSLLITSPYSNTGVTRIMQSTANHACTRQ